MPWGRLDDSLYDHPKLDDLPSDEVSVAKALGSVEACELLRLAAIGFWTLTISWSNRHLTDGHIPRSRIDKLGGSIALAEALVVAGLYEKTATGYLVHDFLVFNASRADVLERRAKEAKRKEQWRRKRDAEKVSHGTEDGTSSVDDEDVPQVVPPSVPTGQERLSQRDKGGTRARANPDPTRPDPTHTRPIGSTSDSPQPPTSGGRRSRANGTSPRQVERLTQKEAERRAIDARWRRQQRQLAYYRGALTEGELGRQNAADAPLEEIPDWAAYQEAKREASEIAL